MFYTIIIMKHVIIKVVRDEEFNEEEEWAKYYISWIDKFGIMLLCKLIR